MIEVNDIVTIATKGMLEAEQAISLYRINHPWLPTLVKAILDVPYWKVSQSQLLNKQPRKIDPDNVISRMITYTHLLETANCIDVDIVSKISR